ncbi:Nn.00g076950.m01.CDS01 [Neocucurbitaria sp. VM-36]
MRPLRPLPPAVRRPRATPPPSRRDRVASACDACRARKTRCNGERPVCLECVKRSTSCYYVARLAETQGQAIKRKHDEMQVKNEAYDELFSLIKTRPENESHEILRRIKMGAGVESVLRHVKDADLLIQLTLIPESRRRYTLPYTSSMPAILLVPDNPYLSSPLYEAPFEQPSAPSSSGTAITNPERYFKPYHAAEIVEPLLDHVCAKDWTVIIADDGLFRRLISIYLLHQHSCLYWFNKNLFLEDMAARRTLFCSPLLVNAVLASACQAYKGISDLNKFWMPENLQTRFLLETKRLWELEQNKSCLTAIHAAMVLHSTLNGNGMDREGRFYTLQAIAIAHDLRLFDPPPVQLKPRLRRGREYTAWALWTWQVSEAYYFRRTPVVKAPPSFAAPDPAADQAWYGEIYVRYPLSSILTPIHYGHLFSATIGLRLILNDLAILQFNDLGSKDLSNEQLLEFIARLEEWMKALPSSLSAQSISHPFQLKVHAEYYMTLHSLLHTQAITRPDFLDSNNFYNGQSALETQKSAHIRFETLMRLWYLRHSFRSYDAWVTLFLTYLGNLALNSLDVDESTASGPSSSALELRRSTVVLSINGLNSQSHCYYLGALLSRSMIDRLGADDMARLGSHISSSGSQVEGPFDSQACFSLSIGMWPLPNVKIVDNPDSASLNNLLKELRDLTMTTQKAES